MHRSTTHQLTTDQLTPHQLTLHQLTLHQLTTDQLTPASAHPLAIHSSKTDCTIVRVANPPSEFSVKFWGVRGSIPTPAMETVRYGGNTACVELQVAGKRIVFDGGTGLRMLGKSLQQPVSAHIFFTHTHWDRIQGFPFFSPAFLEGNAFDIYGAMGANGASIKQRLSDQMLRPNFPVPLQVMRSTLRFHDIAPGAMIKLDDVTIETISLNRQNSALGYRVTWAGRSVVYATDTESTPNQIDQGLLFLAQQADLLIFDAAYADNHYYDPAAIAVSQKPETWYAALEAVTNAQVKQVVVFHHDPDHDDECLDRVGADIRSRFPNVQLAREGTVFNLLESHS